VADTFSQVLVANIAMLARFAFVFAALSFDVKYLP
jgi:hypothetical protein